MAKKANLRNRISFVLVGLDIAVLAVVALTSGYSGPQDTLVLVGIGDFYGLTAAAFLYLTLLVSPLALAFPKLPGRETWFLARRGLGLSSLVFALPHALVSFFGPLGGFPGLSYLDPYTGWGVLLGLGALVILVALGSTAWDGAVKAMGQKSWKLLHRTVYLVGLLVFVHILLAGTHYSEPRSAWMFWTLASVGFLVFLQSIRFDAWWAKRYPGDRRFGPMTLLAVVAITSAWFWMMREPSTASDPGETRWVTGHHGMVLPAPAPAPEVTQP